MSGDRVSYGGPFPGGSSDVSRCPAKSRPVPLRPCTARSVPGGWGLSRRCPVTGPAPPARTRRPSRLLRHVTKPGDTWGANGTRHPRNRPPPGAPRAGALGNAQRHAAGTGPYHPTGAPSSERRSGARRSRHTDGPSSCLPPRHLTGETRRRRPSSCETPATPSQPQRGVQGQPRGAGAARPGCSIGVRLNCGGGKQSTSPASRRSAALPRRWAPPRAPGAVCGRGVAVATAGPRCSSPLPRRGR